jgi:hypothetical protein
MLAYEVSIGKAINNLRQSQWQMNHVKGTVIKGNGKNSMGSVQQPLHTHQGLQIMAFNINLDEIKAI